MRWFEDVHTSSSPMWPIISLSIFNRSAASTSKPVAGVVVDGSGNQVLYLWAKARALKRAAFRSGLNALYLRCGQCLFSELENVQSLSRGMGGLGEESSRLFNLVGARSSIAQVHSNCDEGAYIQHPRYHLLILFTPWYMVQLLRLLNLLRVLFLCCHVQVGMSFLTS